MKHPERLAWAEELPEGYYLDDLTQVRHRETGDLVCGWSGRGHRHYLLPLPWPDPTTGEVLVLMVDRDAMRDFGRSTKRAGRAVKRGALRGFMGRLLGQAVKVLVGKM